MRIWFYNEFKEYRESWSKPPIYSWLPEFEEWIAEKYDVTVFPTTLESSPYGSGTIKYIFSIYPYSYRDMYRIFGKDFEKFSETNVLIGKIKELIAKYNEPEISPNDIVDVEWGRPYTYYYLRFELLDGAMEKEKEKIVSLFSYLNPLCVKFYGGPLMPIGFILNTKAEAKQFLLSDEPGKLRQKVYDILKPYDEHNVLKPEHIRLLPDYEEHFRSISMYGRWISDMDENEYNWFIGTLLES